MPVVHELMINTISDLDRCLPIVCEEVIRHLGAQNLESSYQKALKYELSQIGIDVLSEGICTILTKIMPYLFFYFKVKLNVMYKDIVVGTRRADLVLKLKDNTKIGAFFISLIDILFTLSLFFFTLVIELKAVKHLSSDNMEQLYYYMAHLRCNIGYLINFPHETGFPDVHNVGIVTGNHSYSCSNSYSYSYSS